MEVWFYENGIQAKGGEQFGSLSVGPLRYMAMKAGLGIIRKNNFFYTENGSYNNLFAYVIDQECELIHTCSAPPCSEKCDLCRRACKTKALEAPYTMNPFKCVSFLTTFGNSDTPEGLSDEMYEQWVCGCDNCQDACPYNRRHDWKHGLPLNKLEEIAPAILPENYENLTDEFLIKNVIPKTANQVYCDRVHYLKCPVCGRVYEVTDKRLLREGPKACSQKCINMLKRQGNKPGIKFKLCNPIPLQPNDLTLKLFHFLRSYHIKYEEAYIIDGYTYSCLLPDIRVLIICSNPEFEKDKFIHRTYTEVANKHEFRCIHIYPFDNVGLVVQNLCPKIKVNLKDCTLYKLYPAIGEDFLNRWHIQGSRRGQKLIVGIAKGQTLLQAMYLLSYRNTNY